LPKALRLGIGQTIGLMVFQRCLALAGSLEQAERERRLVVLAAE
jgi:hypothetical protein